MTPNETDRKTIMTLIHEGKIFSPDGLRKKIESVNSLKHIKLELTTNIGEKGSIPFVLNYNFDSSDGYFINLVKENIQNADINGSTLNIRNSDEYHNLLKVLGLYIDKMGES